MMDIKPHDGVEIFVDNNCIILKKYNPSCILCGNTNKLFYFREKIICEDCIEETANYVFASQTK
jgi:transcriptional pleiotropic regulator of transition state genes